jgi:hypothetical protein
MQVTVLINGHASQAVAFSLPSGRWGVWVDEQSAGDKVLREVPGPSMVVPATSGVVLVRQE